MLDWVRAVTGADQVSRGERIQSLWSGYGEIVRFRLGGARAGAPSVVLKRVSPPNASGHPRGWDTDRSHARKLRSYAVEQAFYRDFAARCDERCRVPRCLASEASATGWRFLLEDLDASGFSARRDELSDAEIDHCLAWLASFHATFLGVAPDGLWPVGTYWHLETRPDELAAIGDPSLRRAAERIDARLNRCAFQTLVHGDAKLANFCFRPDGSGVAAVDFQYVGGGCGMKDVAYFRSSCLSSAACAASAEAHLDRYFAHLRAALARRVASEGLGVDVEALEREWRALYAVAWADFYRFLAGWSPGHWKLHAYSRALTDEVLRTLDAT